MFPPRWRCGFVTVVCLRGVAEDKPSANRPDERADADPGVGGGDAEALLVDSTVLRAHRQAPRAQKNGGWEA